MIEIIHKENCCGCGACVSICPKNCIVLSPDEEGFLYPKVTKKECIDCHLCEKVCPIYCNDVIRHDIRVFGCEGDNDIRAKSSSGGVFSLLAQTILEKDGIVFGAKFDNFWQLRHDYVNSVKDLDSLRRSKYIQSQILDSYKLAQSFLESNRNVLFCGTPCQIAGLRSFLKKDYDSLLLVDIICHGVPSPAVWKKYLDEFIKNVCHVNKCKKQDIVIQDINFRDKSAGWSNYNFSITYKLRGRVYIERKNIHEDFYMKLFLENVILRPSCYACKFRNQKSGSDLTLGDFWGCDNFILSNHDDKGISLVLCNTDKGYTTFSNIALKTIIPVNYIEVSKYNSCLNFSCKIPSFRNRFFLLNRFFSLDQIFRYYSGKSCLREKLLNHFLFLLFRK